MLTTPEKFLFVLASLITVALTWRGVVRLIRIIGRGGRPDWRRVPQRLIGTLGKTLTFAPVFRERIIPSLFHGLVGWGFLYYLLVNVGDVLHGYLPNFVFMGDGLTGNLYRLLADVLSVAVLVGMVALMVRRFLVRPASFMFRGSTLLHPKARRGIKRDSAIVGIFILLHVGSRFLGESFHLASSGLDAWQPFASAMANLWREWPPGMLVIARHVAWWLALGLILAFIPYFPYSKHIHLFFAPLNFLLGPERRSMGELEALDFEDQAVEQFGAERLEHLPWWALMDAYACIMCNRCQDACPAYQTGKVLSPAAMEINKRYLLNQEGASIAAGNASSQTLKESVISYGAVWACTACAACVDVCPVNNKPMHDIMEIRRHSVLMENDFPGPLQSAFRGMERAANPWNVPREARMAWAEGLEVPTVEEKPQSELLWWVGCAPAIDPRAQKTARAFARVLKAANVDFAVLGKSEQCTGDSARRAGNEYVFQELAKRNIETLNQVKPKRIVTTCPHCLHTIKNEYPAFGGHYAVVHHTQLLQELIASGRLDMQKSKLDATVSFHDPCYLGRMNGLYKAPRESLKALGIRPLELPRNRGKSFCCGAGGGQMWKEEEEGRERVSANRLREALEAGVGTLAVGCPFCMVMLSDASADAGSPIQIRDVVEILDEHLDDKL